MAYRVFQITARLLRPPRILEIYIALVLGCQIDPLNSTENSMGAPGNVVLSSTGLPLVIPSSSPTAGAFSTIPPFTNSNDNNCSETVFGARGKRHKHSQGLFGIMKRKLVHDIGTASSSTDKEASNQHRTFNEHTDTSLSESSTLPVFENFGPSNFQSLGMTKATMRKKSKHKAFNEDKPWKHHSYAFTLSESEKEVSRVVGSQ